VAHVREDVRGWFARRTWRAGDFPAAEIGRRKGSTTVSVVLPALNEEHTVGRIVERIRRDLVGPAAIRAPLVDELVVMDSGSSDRTPEVAAAAGARVVHREQVLRHLEVRPGKGEVLWRSLAATSGDVLVFIDSDLTDFSSDFVTGLLGPLLTSAGVDFVKATYDRPVHAGASGEPAGGGRVTELVARPLINMHWPHLAGFVQPLSGECAARRALLESLPFPCGYGVEFGLLVDTARSRGIDAMGQVDLTRRKHRNQANEKLGRMAAEIWQVALTRLRQEGRLDLADGPGTVLTQYVRAAGRYQPVDCDVAAYERPPMAEVSR
jgi:glucosyl-3-phosphoglycerate synthase